MNSRDRILQRLRSSADAPRPDPLQTPCDWPLPERSEWLALFRQNLSDNHAEVIECDDNNWPELVASVLAEKGVSVLRSGNHAEGRLLVDSVSAMLDAACITAEQSKETLFHQIDAGFSVATAGLAETGSLVIVTGANEPRTLSLVPPLNIVLLRASAMVANFSQLVAQGRMPSPMPTNVLLISGPSKTADIQQTLAYGAHGPKQLVVILVMDI